MINNFANVIQKAETRLSDDVINIGGRFGAYRSNYFSRLISTLEAQFPVTSQLVGQDFFSALVQEYATRFPPSSPFLSQYGKDFSNFLMDFEPVQQVPYLPDVARLEWARAIAQTVIGLPPRPLSSEEDILHALNLPVSLALGASLVHSAYPIGTIWARHQEDAPEPVTNWHSETVAIWPASEGLWQNLLSDEEQTFFEEIELGRPIGAHLQSLEDEAQIAAMIGAFVKFINLGFLTFHDPENGELVS